MPNPLVEEAKRAARKHGVDPDIFVRMIQQESGFNPKARNPVSGAAGIGQFMPFWWQEGQFDPYDPIESLDRSAAYLSSNLKRFGGDYAKALAAYNAGPGAVEKFGGVPPFQETQTYVRNILGGSTPTAFQGKGNFDAQSNKSMASIERLAGMLKQENGDARQRPVDRLLMQQMPLSNYINELASNLLGRGF